MAARSAMTVTSATTIATSWGNNVRDHVVARTTSDDVSAEGQLAANTSSDKLVIYTGSAATEIARYGADDSFTATVTQSFGVSATTYTHTRRRGRWCEGNLRLDFTSSGSSGSAIQIATTLPVPTRQIIVGQFWSQDVALAFYSGVVLLSTSAGLECYAHNTNAILGTAPSFAIASGDQLYISFSYPAASV